jgi:probable F420-dependent oxidoreductase
MRWGVSLGPLVGVEGTDLLRRYADGGINRVWAADHLGAPDPFVPLAAAVAITDLDVGLLVANHDFWHPAMFGRAVGSLAAFAPGRVTWGVGAGHAEIEYLAQGIEFASPARRVARLEGFVDVVTRLLAGDSVDHDDEWFTLRECALGSATPATPPRLLVGGNGDRVLRLAATTADEVGLVGFTSGNQRQQTNLTHFTWEGLAERLAFTRAHRDDRPLDVQVLVQQLIVTDDPDAALGPLATHAGIAVETVRDCPFVLVGPLAFLREQVARLESMGVGELTVFGFAAEEVLTLLAR